ncbi:MAG: DUF2948 family protein [Parvibaculales bacterium]
MSEPLHLWAQDTEDLVVISATLQDAVLKADDMSFDKGRRVFALVANRYCWEQGQTEKKRTRCGVHFENVLAVRSKNISQKSDQPLALLAVIFDPDEKEANTPSPEGIIRLMFSGDAEMNLHVEGLKVVMQDVTGQWAARSTPNHDEE